MLMEGTGKYFSMLFLVFLIVYITSKICVGFLFKRAKVPFWKAYIPFYTPYVIVELLDLKKTLFLAEIAFLEIYDSEFIKNTLKVFYKRFITNQFKRSCLPDGPKVLNFSLSPRTDLKMPSDAAYDEFIENLEE